MNSFPCTSCGACCRKLKQAISNLKSIGIDVDFPYKWDENGVCEMLSEDNKCLVYHDRPVICNVEKLAEYLGFDTKEFYVMNSKACNELIKESNLPEKYLVKI